MMKGEAFNESVELRDSATGRFTRRLTQMGLYNETESCMPGQYSHPHCHVSPDGHWLSYNRGEGGRSDVYLVRAACRPDR